jgi:general secretion pathway protein N
MRQRTLLAVIGAVVFLGVGIATLPASLLVARLPAELTLQGVGGSVWHGAADSVRLRAVELGALRWDLDAPALLRGRLEYEVALERADGYLRGRVAATPGGTLLAHDLRLALPVGALSAVSSANGWRGNLTGTVQSARVAAGWPTALVGQFEVAQLRPPGSTLEVGSYTLEFSPGSGTAARLVGLVRDHEAPLVVRAQLAISSDRSYVLEGEVTPRPQAPPEVVNAIAFLGAPDAAGRRSFTVTGTF